MGARLEGVGRLVEGERLLDGLLFKELRLNEKIFSSVTDVGEEKDFVAVEDKTFVVETGK